MKNIKYIISRYGLNNSNIVAKNGILLPCHHGLKEKDVDKILSLLDNFIINLGYETKAYISFLNDSYKIRTNKFTFNFDSFIDLVKWIMSNNKQMTNKVKKVSKKFSFRLKTTSI